MPLGVEISFWGEGHLTSPVNWDRVLRQLNLRLPAGLPLPTGDAQVRATLTAALEPGATTPTFALTFSAEASPPAEARFGGIELGAPLRVTLACAFATADAASAALARWDQGQTLDVTGTLTFGLALRLPTLPQWDIAQVRSGDAEGWVNLDVEFGFQSGAMATEISATARIADAFAADLYMPGARRGAHWLTASVDEMSGTLRLSPGRIFGRLEFTGSFSARFEKAWLMSRDVAAIEPLLDVLLRPAAATTELHGTVSGVLEFDGERPRFGLVCTLVDADVTIDLHDVLGYVRAVVRGQTGPSSNVPPPPAIHPEFGLGLRAFSFELSAEPWAAIELEGKIFGVSFPLFAAVAYRRIGGLELSLGLGRKSVGGAASAAGDALRLPLTIPHVRKADLEPLADLYRQALHGTGLDRYNTYVNAYFTAIEVAVEALTGGTPSFYARKQGGAWVIEPTANAPVRTSKLPVVFASGRTIAGSDPDDRGELAVAYNAGEGWRPLLIRPAVGFERVMVSFPVQNLRDIRVSGTVRFTCDGPFAKISDLPVTLGLSTDMIYASVDTEGGVTLEVPEFLPGYGGGQIVIGQFRVGFGYTKRSFALAFAGQLTLPQKLVDDLDTSDVAGAGIRLPVKSNLALRFDLIPFVLGKLVLPLPSFQFNWDLRRSAAAANVQDRARCEPGWDGLQLIVPGQFRAGLERISFSPLLGGVVSYWNSDFAGDLQVGDEHNGFTACFDNSMWAYAGDPSIYTLPLIPILSIPFFEDACVALRAGGFTLGFDLQRPLPTFSPFALFELLALASDPLNYQVAPRGDLANTLRTTLAHGRLTLPPAVRALFPGSGALVELRDEYTVNLADYIHLLQLIGRAVAPVIDAALSAARSRQLGLAQLQAQLGALRSAELRRLAFSLAENVPPALRHFSVGVDFAGFRGQADIGFVTRTELLAMLQPAAPISPASALTGGMAWNAEAMRSFQPKLRGGAPLASAVGGGWGRFQELSAEDLREIPLPSPPLKFAPADLRADLIAWLATATVPLAKKLRSYFKPPLPDPGALPLGAGPHPMVGFPAGLGLGLGHPSAPRVVTPAEAAEAFDCALVDPALCDPKVFGELPSWLRAKQRAVGVPPDEKRLRLFNRLLLEVALPQFFSADEGVLCAATLEAFGTRFSLIGRVAADGAFALVTRGALAVPRLAIAGIPLTLPLQLAARGTLAGVVRNGVASGTLRLEATAAATLIPAIDASSPAALAVTLGSAEAPVVVELSGDGRHRVDGTGTVRVFGPLAMLAGTVAISEQRLAVSGRLRCCGLEATNASCVVDASGLSVRAQLRSPANAAVAVEVDASFHGRIASDVLTVAGAADFRMPEFAFALSGAGRWTCDAVRNELAIDGRCTWQGLANVEAGATVRSNGISARARLHVAHRVSELLARLGTGATLADAVPSGLGDMLVTLDLSVELALAANGTIATSVAGTWSIALQSPTVPEHFHTLLENRISGQFTSGALLLFDLAHLTPLFTSLAARVAAPVTGHPLAVTAKDATIAGQAVTTYHLVLPNGTVVPDYPNVSGSPDPRIVVTIPNDLALHLGPPSSNALELAFQLKMKLGWKDHRFGVWITTRTNQEKFAPLGG